MAKSSRRPPLSALPSFDEDGHVNVVIETPRGSRSKLAYSPELWTFLMKKVLPQGMTFPFDFGFVPSTLADDGDPLDVLVLLDEPVPPGVVVPCRLIGVIEALEEEDSGKMGRNDRIIGAAIRSELFDDMKRLDDVPAAVVEQIEQFFVNYNQQAGKRFKLKGRHGPQRAATLLEKARRRFKRKR